MNQLTTRRRLLKGIIDTSMNAVTSTWLQELAEEFGITHEDLYRIDLCFAELVVNVVSYAEAQFVGQPMELHAAVEAERITLTLIDPAQAFDPLTLAPPAKAEKLEDLQIGGQGIPLVREFSNAQSYERRDGKNRVELRFDLAVPTKAPCREAMVPRGIDRRGGDVPATFPLHCRDGSIVERERRQASDRRAKSFLSWSQIFHGVPYSDLEELVDRFPIQSIVGGAVVLSPGEMNSEVLIVLAGRLEIYLDQPGAGTFIEIAPGGCVGEMSVIDNQPASAYVVAGAGTKVLVVDANSFLNEVMAIPNVSRNLMAALSERMRRSNEQIILRVRKEMEMERVQHELAYARSIQESLLPKAPLFPGEPRLDCVGRMITAREVGGDFYDIFALDAHHVFFVIADVCGKGLPAALFMVRAMAALRAQSGGHHQPAEYVERVMVRLNEQLCAYNDAQQFLTAFAGIIDLDTLMLHYVNAGHNAPLLALGNDEFTYISDPVNPIVGMIDGIAYRAGKVALTPGSALLLYTDGVTEAENTFVEMLGEDRLQARMNAVIPRRSESLVEAVFVDVHEFAGEAAQSDDITVLSIRVAPPVGTGA
jgi:serine phosphatase RsbU (regulator of sigma subunit)/anti-sigma regulatory factor (Ser/Thr protein kinase)